MVEKAYHEMYQTMEKLKAKGLKMSLKRNLQGVLFTDIKNTNLFLNIEEKKYVFVIHNIKLIP